MRPTLILFTLTAVFSLLILTFMLSATPKTSSYTSTLTYDNAKKEKVEDTDFIRIKNTLSKMSRQFQEEIKIEGEENIKSFASDIKTLLEEEKTFPKDDISLFYLIDKTHPAPRSYVPSSLTALKANNLFNLNRKDLSLRSEALASLEEMATEAKKEGVTLLVSSTYRSYEYQENLFNRWVRLDGLEEAERESARAGHSQHQLGTAIDFGSISDDFDKTPMGQWLYKNASKFGWSLSFPKGYEEVTGYRWECWHFRYIGKKACGVQNKWFSGVQQYLLEFLDTYKNEN